MRLPAKRRSANSWVSYGGRREDQAGGQVRLAEAGSGQYGVGYFTWVAYGIVKYSSIIVGMLTIGVLGMISSTLIRLAGAWLMPWRPRSAKEEA